MPNEQRRQRVFITSAQAEVGINYASGKLAYLAVRLRPEVSARDLQSIVQTQTSLIMQVLNGLSQLC